MAASGRNPKSAAHRLNWLFTFILLVAGGSAAFSQHSLVLYNMQQVPQSNLLNPGQIPLMKAYFGFPFISGVRVGAGNTGFTYNQFDMANKNDAYDFDYAGLRDHLKSGTNRVSTDFEIQLISFGFRVGKGFLNVDVGDVVFGSGTYTPALLDMFDDIQNYRLIIQEMETTYDQSRQDLNGAYYRSYSVSYGHQVLPNLSLGGRFRYLQGKVGTWTENEGLMFHYPGDGNYFQVRGQMNLLSAGTNNFDDPESSFFLFGGGNHGFAFDFGGVYRVNDQIELSISAVNLGQITWKKDVNYQVVADHLQFSAVDIEDHLDLWGEIGDSLLNGQPVNADVRFTTPLPQRFYLGGNYYFNPNTSLGLVINPVRFNGATDVALAVTGNMQIGKTLGLSAAMAYNRYSPFNLGLGMSLDLGPFQLYAITDNLISTFSWKNAHAVQAQFGINFKFGSMGRENTLSPPVTEAFAGEEEMPDQVPVAPAPLQEEAQPSDAEALPSPTVITPPVVLPANPRFFTLAGTVRDAGTGEVLKSIVVEAYKIGSNGEKELAYTGSFYSGNLSIPLSRGFSHQIIITRIGYQPEETFLEATRVGADEAEVKRDFILRQAAAPVSPPLRPTPPPAAPEEQAPAAAPAPVSEEVMVPQEEVQQPEQSWGEYRLTEKTSLRQGPSHTTDVLLRFNKGDRVEVLEKTGEWWWKVRFKDQTGYVKAQLLTQE